ADERGGGFLELSSKYASNNPVLNQYLSQQSITESAGRHEHQPLHKGQKLLGHAIAPATPKTNHQESNRDYVKNGNARVDVRPPGRIMGYGGYHRYISL